jgi:hypothetical protein
MKNPNPMKPNRKRYLASPHQGTEDALLWCQGAAVTLVFVRHHVTAHYTRLPGVRATGRDIIGAVRALRNTPTAKFKHHLF